MELDQPILIHDKLEIIWHLEDARPAPQRKKSTTDEKSKTHSTTFEGYNLDLKQYVELSTRKNRRLNVNHQQIDAYNKMLDHIENREAKRYLDSRSRKTYIHEKEREFFDAIRLIIQNGYELVPKDITDILNFTKISELQYFELPEQTQVA